jgi:hypothetical protein
MITWGKSKKITHCEHCKTKLAWRNTSPVSVQLGYCHACHNDLVNKGIIKP